MKDDEFVDLVLTEYSEAWEEDLVDTWKGGNEGADACEGLCSEEAIEELGWEALVGWEVCEVW